MIFWGRTIVLSALLLKYEFHQDELPYWYRLFLNSKGERPFDAAEFTMRLSNTRKLEHALKQVNEIKGFLRLK